MNTPELMKALSDLRVRLFENRVFYLHQQQIVTLLNFEFPTAQTYFDNNGTYKIQLSEEAAAELRATGDMAIPSIYDKVNDMILKLFRLYAHDLKNACEGVENGDFLYEYIIDGRCPYLGVLYQARFINSVILIEV